MSIREQEYWPTVEAEILKSRLTKDTEGSFQIELRCRYQIESNTYENLVQITQDAESLPPEIAAGRTVTLHYDPENPVRSDADPESDLGGVLCWVFTGGGLILFGGFWMALGTAIRVLQHMHAVYMRRAHKAVGEMEEALDEMRAISERMEPNREIADELTDHERHLEEARERLRKLEQEGS